MTGLVLERAAPGAWNPWGLRDDEAADDAAAARAEARALALLRRRRALVDLLGPVWFRPTLLPRLSGQGPALGPARAPDGMELRWYLWAPRRGALLDRFRALPPAAELDARAAFARLHGLRYGVVPPGWRLTIDTLRAWLGEG